MKKFSDSRSDIQPDATQQAEQGPGWGGGRKRNIFFHFSHFAIKSHYFPYSPVSGVRLGPTQQLQLNVGKQ